MARRVGVCGKLARLDRRGEQPRETLVDAGQGFDDDRAYFGIGDDVGGCGQHRETPARPCFARRIEIERGDQDALGLLSSLPPNTSLPVLKAAEIWAALPEAGITGVDVSLPIAGPGSRSYAFIIDWHIRVVLALAWFVAAMLIEFGSLRFPVEPK